MAVTATNLTFGETNTDATSYSTASITPSANKLILLAVFSERAGSNNPSTPFVSGNGFTWDLLATQHYDAEGTQRHQMNVFRTMGAAPSAGAITIDYLGITHTGCIWDVTEFGGVDTGLTEGEAAIAQMVTNAGVGTSGSVTLVSPTAGNATFGAFGHEANEITTVGTGFTALSNQNHINTACAGLVEWRNDAVATVDASWTTSEDWGGIAIEIKAAVAAEPGKPAYRRIWTPNQAVQRASRW